MEKGEGDRDVCSFFGLNSFFNKIFKTVFGITFMRNVAFVWHLHCLYIVSKNKASVDPTSRFYI